MTAQQPTPPAGPYNPMFGLQEKVAALLTPIFHDANAGEHFGYQAACRSLQAFEPETRADFLNAGRTIAFGLASMVLAQEIFNPALELAEKKKAAIHANALNRSADQAERSMMERRRYRRAYPMFPVPQEAEPDEEQAQPQLQGAVTACAATQPAPSKPETESAPAPVQPSTIHYAGPSRTSTPPSRPHPLPAPAMLQAATPNGPAQLPVSQ